MEITMIHGQRHKGSTYHVAKSLADKITQADTTVHEFFMPSDGPNVKIRFLFGIMRQMQKKNTWNMTDSNYWRDMKWLDEARPWQQV